MRCHTHHGALVQQSRYSHHPYHKGTCSVGHHLPLAEHWKGPNTESCFLDLSNLGMHLRVDTSPVMDVGGMGVV
jgi:hypothetical protein